MSKTLFERIIDREIEADIVWENERIIAFNDISPQAPTHILIVPKKVISSLNELEEEDRDLIGEMFIVAKNIAEEKGISENGYRTIFNTIGCGCYCFRGNKKNNCRKKD